MELLKLIFLSLCLCLCTSETHVDFLDDVVVRLPNGGLRGELITGENGKNFYSFKGIPYAEPPLGNLRFKPPVPRKPWNYVMNVVKDGPICPQLNPFSMKFSGNEDCLYLNVYTPKLPEVNKNLKMGVVYHIHGGAFMSLAGTSTLFGPKRFPLDEIVLVSVTYRVGPLGFLSTDDSVSRGNYGLLDQVEGLRWVRNNIHYFGGDPNKVTILGESAGGASVIYHMLSPLSEGLFQRAIAMSGSALCKWGLQKNPSYWSSKLGNETDCPTNSSEELVECLRGKSAEDLTTKGSPFIRGIVYPTFVPTMDNYFINDTPINIVKKREYNIDVSLIIGTTKNEGNCFYSGRKNSDEDFTDEEIEDLIRGSVDIRPDVETKIQLIKEKYFGSNITSYNQKIIQERINAVFTDGLFHKCIFHTAKEMADAETKTFLYQYDFEAPFSFSMFYMKPPEYGVCHADDLFMFFDGIFGSVAFNEQSLKMKEQFQRLFLNFVKYGIPVLQAEETEQCKWPPAEMNNLSIYHINDKCTVQIYDEKKDPLYKFWIEDVNEA